VNIIYTMHALERIRQRGINKNLVLKCLSESDKDEELENVRRCIKKINDKLIVVIYRKEDNNFIIITAYITTKVHKYFDKISRSFFSL